MSHNPQLNPGNQGDEPVVDTQSPRAKALKAKHDRELYRASVVQKVVERKLHSVREDESSPIIRRSFRRGRVSGQLWQTGPYWRATLRYRRSSVWVMRTWMFGLECGFRVHTIEDEEG